MCPVTVAARWTNSNNENFIVIANKLPLFTFFPSDLFLKWSEMSKVVGNDRKEIGGMNDRKNWKCDRRNRNGQRFQSMGYVYGAMYV